MSRGHKGLYKTTENILLKNLMYTDLYYNINIIIITSQLFGTNLFSFVIKTFFFPISAMHPVKTEPKVKFELANLVYYILYIHCFIFCVHKSLYFQTQKSRTFFHVSQFQ